MQKKASTGQEIRPYLKNYLAAWKDFDVKVGAILPRVFVISELGRVMLLTEEFTLIQIDVNRKQQMNDVSLLCKTPFRKKKPIDFFFVRKQNRIFVLCNNWSLYVWDITQPGTVPLSVIKLPEGKAVESHLERSYRNNFNGIFPVLLSGS
jgi:hypothetical protein